MWRIFLYIVVSHNIVAMSSTFSLTLSQLSSQCLKECAGLALERYVTHHGYNMTETERSNVRKLLEECPPTFEHDRLMVSWVTSSGWHETFCINELKVIPTNKGPLLIGQVEYVIRVEEKRVPTEPKDIEKNQSTDIPAGEEFQMIPLSDSASGGQVQ